MVWWWSKLFLGIILITHSVIGNLGFIGFMPQPSSWLAIALICVGGVTNLYHYYLIKRKNPDISKPGSLITDCGLFRFSRHPMYFCDLLVYLGLALYPISYLSMFLYVLSVVVIIWLAHDEDEKMAKRFTDSFAVWQKSTSLLLPFPGR